MEPQKVPSYSIFFHRKANKFLESLDEQVKCKLLEDIVCLANFPELDRPLDIAKMEGQKGFYRLRPGKLRTIFTVDKVTKTIFVLKIAQREAAYE
jgi:mRNA-degrading endonuclease RelE of RelBE toxin-antitoxin system